MDYPQTRAELVNRNYQTKPDGRNRGKCKSCGADMEWWSTPKGKNIPMNPMPFEDSAAVAHWVTCPNADSFRASRPQQTTRTQQPIGTFKPGAQPYMPPSRPYEPAEIDDNDIPF